MTSPPVPIQQMPGVDDALQGAVEPFLAALKERREREMKQQQIAAQIGQLQLQREQFETEQKDKREQLNAMKDAAAALSDEYKKAGAPGNYERILQGGAGSGNLQSAIGAISNLEAMRTGISRKAKQQQLIDNFAPLMAAGDPGKMFEYVARASAEDPDLAGPLSNLANLVVRQGTQDGRWAIDTQLIEGVAKRVIVRGDGTRQVIGDALPLQRENRPVMGEREKASVAAMAIPLQERLRQMEIADYTVGNRVYAKVAKAYGAGGFAARLLGKQDPRVIEASVEATMSDEERRYYSDAKGLLSAVIPGLAGKVVTGNELVTHGAPMFSTGTGDERTIKAKSANRDARIRNAVAESGDAFADRVWELKGYDLGYYGWRGTRNMRAGATEVQGTVNPYEGFQW